VGNAHGSSTNRIVRTLKACNFNSTLSGSVRIISHDPVALPPAIEFVPSQGRRRTGILVFTPQA
jgi:hypothetical protein